MSVVTVDNCMLRDGGLAQWVEKFTVVDSENGEPESENPGLEKAETFSKIHPKINKTGASRTREFQH
jgi:hypothetical protein